MLQRRAGWVLAAMLAAGCRREPPLPEIPRPNLQKLSAHVAEQLQKAYEQVQSAPRDAAANGRLGMSYQAHGWNDLAIPCYQRARRFDRREFRWAYYLGLALADAGRLQEAARTLEEALRLQPDYAAARLKLAETLFQAGDLVRSRRLYEEAVRREGRSAEARLGLGRVLSAQGDHRGALEHLELACSLAPNYGAAHYAAALAYRSLGDQASADRHFALHQQYRQIRPPTPDPLGDALRETNTVATSYAQKAMALAQLNRLEEAAHEFRRALEADPQYAPAHANLVALYWKLGDFPKAEQHYLKAVELAPQAPEPYLNYALLLSQQGRYAESEKAFRKVLEIQPAHAEARTQFGFSLEKQGKVTEAEEQYRQALEAEAGHRQANFLYGRRLLERGKNTMAIEHLLKSLTPEDERTPWFMRVLSGAYARSGDRLSAIHYAQEAQRRAVARGMRQLAVLLEKDLQGLQRP
jgi:tetratricopeptide (TPR) repeat protein